MGNTASNEKASSTAAGKAAWIILFIAWLCFLLPIPGIGLFIGLPLNIVAFILAIVALAQGGTKNGLFQLLSSIIISPIIYLIGFLIFGALIAGNAQ